MNDELMKNIVADLINNENINKLNQVVEQIIESKFDNENIIGIVEYLISKNNIDLTINLLTELKLKNPKESFYPLLLSEIKKKYNNNLAIEVLEDYYKINNSDYKVTYMLAFLSMKEGLDEKADFYSARCIEISKTNLDAFILRAEILNKNHKYEEAYVSFAKALELKPDDDNLLYNIGVTAEKIGQFEQAKQFYTKALRRNNSNIEARWNLALRQIYDGNYEEGYSNYQVRLKKKEYLFIETPLPYNKQELNGKKILILWEQGLGDFLQMSRYLRLLKKFNVYIILELRKELIEFVKKENLADKIIERGIINIPSYDYLVYYGSLPYYFLNYTPPNHYLNSSETVKTKINKKIKIGICWRGNPNHERNRFRSINLNEFEILLELNNIEIICLQFGSKTEEENKILKKYNIQDCSGSFEFLTETIENLDLIITVDTSLAHLAGAKGIKTFLLVEKFHDYRWGKYIISDIYSNVFICRNNEKTWGKLIEKLKEILNDLSLMELNNWFEIKRKQDNISKIFFEHFNIELKIHEINISIQELDLIISYLKNRQFLELLKFIDDTKYKDEFITRIAGDISVSLKLFDKAESYYKTGIKKVLYDWERFMKLALINLEKGKIEVTKKIFEDGIKNTANLELIFNYALFLYKIDLLKESEYYFQETLKIDQTYYRAYEELSFLYFNQNRCDEAKKSAELGVLYNSAVCWFILSLIFKNKEEFDNSEKALLRAIKINSVYYEAYINLANLYFVTGKIFNSLKIYSKLISIFGINTEIKNNILICLSELKLFKVLEKYLEDPDIDSYIKSEILLTIRNFSQGLELYENRLLSINKQIIKEFVSLNEVRGKTVCVLSEQSHGDMLFFLRFCEKLKTYGAKVIVNVSKEIERLVISQPYIDDINLDNDADYIISAGSLMKYFIKTNNYKDNKPYIFIENKVKFIKNYDTQKIKVGICWKGNPLPIHNRKRHIPITELELLTKIQDVELYNLQVNCNKEEKEFLTKHNIQDLTSEINDFLDTAILISELDYIITVDTAIAHLAGALGKKVFLMLCYASDWRWGVDEKESIWYQNVTLFRQHVPGEWQYVVEKIYNKCINLVDIKLNMLETENAFIELMKNQNYNLAEKFVEDNFLYKSQQKRILLYIAFMYLQIDKTEKALAILEHNHLLIKNSDAQINIANILFECDLLDEAFKYYTAGVNNENQNAVSWFNYGNALYQNGNFAEAEIAIQNAIKIDPEYKPAVYTKGLFELTKSNFKEGFLSYELRYVLAIETHRKIENKWNKESLVGKRLYIYNDQGHGDFIQFSRYLPLLKNYGAYIILEVKSELKRITELLEGIDEIVIQNLDKSITCEYDYAIELSSLPNMIRYYDVPEVNPGFNKLIKYAKPYKKIKVGLFWRGSLTNTRLEYRSCNPNKLFESLSGMGIDLISLQKNNILTEDEEAMHKFAIKDYSIYIEDFFDTATIINDLDLIITIDSSVAHLAGSLKKETWVLLPYVADWRWGLSNNFSKWYISAKLYRQNKRNNWDELFKKIKTDLRTFIKEKGKLNEKNIS